MSSENFSDLRIGVELLKKDMSFLTTLFDKMDKLIQKIETQQDTIVDKTNTIIDKQIDLTKEQFAEIYAILNKTESTINNRIHEIEKLMKEDISELKSDLESHIDNEDNLSKKVNKIIYFGSGIGLLLLWVLENLDLVKKFLS